MSFFHSGNDLYKEESCQPEADFLRLNYHAPTKLKFILLLLTKNTLSL